jgi:lactoylglutathione lyase
MIALFESHLTVADLPRSITFYRDVVGLELAYELPERGAAFFWVGDRGQGLLGLWSLGSAPLGLSLHIAFRIPLDGVLNACRRLTAHEVTPLSFFGEPTGEPSVIGWMPAAAVYFRDPDGHQLEYLAMLDDPPDPERGIVSWSQWTSHALEGPPRGSVEIRMHHGPRGELRPLFELADDAPAQLDGYLDTGRIVIAVEDGRTVGHLQLTGTAAALEVKNMAVLESHQRRGIGRSLMRAAIELAHDEGHAVLAVATATADIGNLRFYQRLGFRMRRIERDAFTEVTGYGPQDVDGIPLRDRVWLDLDLRKGGNRAGEGGGRWRRHALGSAEASQDAGELFGLRKPQSR